MDIYSSININNYIREEKLGFGAFSEVFLYKNEKIIDNKKSIVVKVIKDKYFNYCLKELNILKRLDKCNNEYIIKFLGYQLYKKTLLFFFEYWHMNLYKFYKNIMYGINDIIKISYQLFRALEFIHSIDIIHTDLKPENILIDSKNINIKLIDFGSTLEKNKISYNNFYICTRYYRPPEVIYKLYFNEKIDIWASGCIIAELIMVKPLFPVKVESKLFKLMNDLLGTPKEFEYVYSEKFRECFLYNIGFKLEMFDMPVCFKSKFYKYLDLYKINKLQKKYIIELLDKILIYNFIVRPSATECLKNPLFLEYILPLNH